MVLMYLNTKEFILRKVASLYPANLIKTEHRFPEQLKKQPPEVLYKKTVLQNFSVFTGKQLCQSLFLIKLQTFRWIASAKSRSVRGGSHQPAFMGSCLTICHVFVLSIQYMRRVQSLCPKAPYDWTNGGSVDIFLEGEDDFTSVES